MPKSSVMSLIMVATSAIACVPSSEVRDVVMIDAAGVAPLESTNMASAPEAISGDAHPETIHIVTGQSTDYAWAHGHGFVHASVAQTWTALSEPGACVDRRRVTEWMVEQQNSSGFPVGFRIHNIVRSAVTVEFDTTWRGANTQGSRESPVTVNTRWEKTDGSEFITLLQGSAVLRRLDDQTTEIELIEHLNALGQDATQASQTIGDLYASVVARAHDLPLPTYP